MRKVIISAVALGILTISSTVYAAIRVTNVNSGFFITVRYDLHLNKDSILKYPKDDISSGYSLVYHEDIKVLIHCSSFEYISFRNPRGVTLNIDYYGACGLLFDNRPRFYTYYTEDTP